MSLDGTAARDTWALGAVTEGGGADADSGLFLAAATTTPEVDEAISYGLVYARLSRSAGEACDISLEGGREPSRDGSIFIIGVLLTAVKLPLFTAVKPPAGPTAGALVWRAVPLSSLLESGLSWILTGSAPFAGDGERCL
jgi:hypothetical protein